MDPHANYHQYLTDIDWLNYFDLLDQLPFGYDTLKFHHTNQVSLNEQDQNYVTELGFPYLDPIDEDLNLEEWWDDGLPLLSCNIDDQSVARHVTSGEAIGTTTTTTDCLVVDHGSRNSRNRSRPLELEEIEKHFEKPIAMAAKELNIGLTMLKKRCRELNIKRWPHRKLKSLKSLIHNVKEFGLKEEIEMLEEQKKMIEKLPEMKLTRRTMKLRQACFKANYKKRRLIPHTTLLTFHSP